MKRLYTFFIIFLLVSSSKAFSRMEIKNKGDVWRKRVFNWIYENNHWAPNQNIPLSGPGSTPQSANTLRTLLPNIIKAINAKTILDAGCGDFTWMQTIYLDVKKYIGIDLAEELIRKNNYQYANERYSFYCMDIAKDQLPQVDLILCRDVLPHLSYEDITLVIKNFKKSGAKYLLTSTYPKVKTNNNDIETGNFRGVNLMTHPFNFPIPVMLFEELSAEQDMKRWGKWIGLWRLDEIDL